MSLMIKQTADFDCKWKKLLAMRWDLVLFLMTHNTDLMSLSLAPPPLTDADWVPYKVWEIKGLPMFYLYVSYYITRLSTVTRVVSQPKQNEEKTFFSYVRNSLNK